MSTIASGVLGIAQGQAPAKGKAADSSENGDFEKTIASLNAKDGESGHKSGRTSISGQGGKEGEEMNGTRTHAAHGDISALADALEKAGAKAGDGKASHAGGAGRTGRKGHAETAEGVDADAEKAALAVAEGAGEAGDAKTDVGNLLELLNATNAASHTVAGHGAAKAAATDGSKAQAGGKVAGKADLVSDRSGTAAEASELGTAEGGEVPQSDTDKLFRLIRADGKGRSLDMSLSGAGDRAAFKDADINAARGETVTVVDARRYIGLAQTGNAAAVTGAITQDPEWAASLSATGGLAPSEAAATGKVVNTLKIQMHPIELGLVTATLRLHGEELVVSLQVETGEAYRQLLDDKDTIVRALRGQGFAVDQISVQLAPADRGAGTQQGDSQGQQQ
ncbi:flagellar hook-length control protein FliK, partial [Shinella sp.]|uniref:flagellar hook-length control protein FliK n=1 Tax=Shinella sp. TaxID=1870904 RepID=UPI0039E5879E